MVPRRKLPVDGSDEPLGNHEKRWHIVRGVPLAFIFTMTVYALVNGGAGIWVASAMNSRIDQLEKIQAAMAPQGERLTRVEEQLKGLKEGIADIKSDTKTLLTQVKR
jgi:septal ring factor EnvC (AmiA/AmiB activator)